MKRHIRTLTVLLSLFGAPVAHACPMCADAVPESADGQSDFDPDRQSKGYNYSIYLMLMVPFALAGGMGFFIYRQCRKVDAKP